VDICAPRSSIKFSPDNLKRRLWRVSISVNLFGAVKANDSASPFDVSRKHLNPA
jgi:hypothetical protein